MICIPVVARTTEEAVVQMGQIARLADIVELRIDQIEDVDLKQLLNGKRTGQRILVTNRRQAEGGGFAGSEHERVGLLMEAIALGADYVDIEAQTEKRLLKELIAQIERHHRRAKWIISDHDFSGTPSERALLKRFETCSRTGADIVKIVTFAHTAEDNLRVLSLIPFARAKGRAIIALCMGEQGRISRVMAPLLGSYLSYASLGKGRESAPGQMTIEEMRKIQEILTSPGTQER
jgi:3-dehydroquinate dehydratase type I